MLFNRAKDVEIKIDIYIDNVIKSGLLFQEGIIRYFNQDLEAFEEKVAELRKLESKSDDLRREIKLTLYTDLLIPESRSDVLHLLEDLDRVINNAQKILVQFSIEKPKVWAELKDDFLELTRLSIESVTEIGAASRAFFRNPDDVANHNVEVHFYEHEADKVEERIMRKAFDGSFITEFAYKVQMRYFAERVSRLADSAENVADRLDIYTIKRKI